ncbi:hypothetical protein ACFX12_009373 [Malus domestica]
MLPGKIPHLPEEHIGQSALYSGGNQKTLQPSSRISLWKVTSSKAKGECEQSAGTRNQSSDLGLIAWSSDCLPCLSPLSADRLARRLGGLLLHVKDTTPGWRKSTSREDATSTYETDKATTITKSDRFRYLGSILQENGELDGDLNHRIQAGWMKCKSASGVLCDRCRSLKLKGKFYRTAIRPAMLYGTECWAVKHQHVHKMGVAEIRMLCGMFRGMCGHTRKEKIVNEDIRGKVGVAEVEGKMRENRLRWFGHVQRRPTDAPVRRCDYGTEVRGRRGRGRLRKTLEETLRKDLEYLDLTEDMTQNRAQWRSRIHIADPT